MTANDPRNRHRGEGVKAAGPEDCDGSQLLAGNLANL